MPARRLTSDAQDLQILAKRKSDAKLAKEIGITETQVVDRRYYLRVRTPKKRSYLPKSQCAPHHKKIVEYLDRGKSFRFIGIHLQISIGAVAGYVRRKKLRRVFRRFDHPDLMVSHGELEDERRRGRVSGPRTGAIFQEGPRMGVIAA